MCWIEKSPKNLWHSLKNKVLESNTIEKPETVITGNFGDLYQYEVVGYLDEESDTYSWFDVFVNDECINHEPFEVVSWQDNSFRLEEGCETPPDSGISRKVFENADSSIEFLFKQIAEIQSRS